MNKNLTELVFITDKSGSMSGLEKDVVGGINSTIKKQREIDGECLISLVLFNTKNEVVYDRVSLKKIKEMESDDYSPYGCTALIDALGDSIHHIKNVHKYIREEDRPGHTIFVITTDGLENASVKYDSDQVKRMIRKQKKQGWEFIFLAANIDAVQTAKTYGIEEDRAVNFVNDSRGYETNYRVLNNAFRCMRSNGYIPKDWEEDIKKDYNSRKQSNNRSVTMQL